MTEISFGSTYRIAITQAGINNAKKDKLRSLVAEYPNALISKNKTGYARVSVSEAEDANFVRKLRTIGYKVYQIFDRHDVKANELDYYIKEQLSVMEYSQKGKNKKPLSAELKQKHRFDRSFDK